MSEPLYCKRCGDVILAPKLACERCLGAAANSAYLDLQRQFIPEIVWNRCDIVMVYIPGGTSGQLSRAWHIQRIGDPHRAFCGRELPRGSKRDRIRYRQYETTKLPCKECTAVLDQLIAAAEPHLLPDKRPVAIPIPIREASCSD